MSWINSRASRVSSVTSRSKPFPCRMFSFLNNKSFKKQSSSTLRLVKKSKERMKNLRRTSNSCVIRPEFCRINWILKLKTGPESNRELSKKLSRCRLSCSKSRKD